MSRKVFLSLVALSIILTLPALAQERTGPIGRMSVSTSAVQWQSTATGFDHLVLTVMLPSGTTVTREFSGSMATFRPGDAAPYVAGDGTYHYTLTAVPRISRETHARLNAARERGDDSAIAAIRAEAGIGEPLVQSGAFTILNGSFVADMPEPGEAAAGKLGAPTTETLHLKPSPNDTVLNDNYDVVGSLCVGFDCVNPESFGFDTIKLKENNTRIHFQDTSTSPGFPNVNWQLTANDSNSGGANKFSIDDLTNSKTPFTVTAAAPTNSLFIASSGKVGLGNNSPVLNLHITATDTPAIRQEQTSGGGFTAQTWDIGANEANWFVRDVTGGSRLPLRIRPGAPTSSIDIAASGNVGVGTASPSNHLHVYDTTTTPPVRIQSTAAGGFPGIQYVDNNGNVNLFLGLDNTNHFVRMDGINTSPIVLFQDGSEKFRVNATGVTVTGNLTATGTKSFAVVDPIDSSKAIYFAALEGPEAGTYFRGTAKTVNGVAVIKLPGYFSRVTECDNMTVQLTPNGAWGQLYVSEKTPQELTIKVADGGKDVAFDFLVQGVRKGYSDFQVERENDLPNQ